MADEVEIVETEDTITETVTAEERDLIDQLIDDLNDGVTGVIEWVHVISDQGRELGRIAMSGIAAYMRGEDGRLISIRISDYAWMEKEIDWTQTGTTEAEARKVNAVSEFPAGVGRKRQETL